MLVAIIAFIKRARGGTVRGYVQSVLNVKLGPGTRQIKTVGRKIEQDGLSSKGMGSIVASKISRTLPKRI